MKEAGVAATASVPRPATYTLPPMPSDLAVENARLLRKVDRLRMEREILKKTVTIFGAGQR